MRMRVCSFTDENPPVNALSERIRRERDTGLETIISLFNSVSY